MPQDLIMGRIEFAPAALDTYSAGIHNVLEVLRRENKRLRRMICAQRHGGLAYMDDGEASFGGDGFQRPTDYLRESLDAIEQAWFEAGKKRIVAELSPNAELRGD